MLNNYKKTLSIISIITILFLLFSNSYNIQNIDKLAYVIALGFDVGDNNNIKLTFQIAVPHKMSMGSDSSSDSSHSSMILNTVECSSINSGINIINSQLSKRINFSHCKIIVFSEEYAAQGIEDEIYTLLNQVDIRSDSNLLICKNNTTYFLESSIPILEKFPVNYYKAISNSSFYTGYTYEATIGEFLTNLKSTTCEPYAILAAVNSSKKNNKEKTTNTSSDTSTKDTADFIAGESSNNSSEKHIECIGLAVFNNDKLVGELSSIETICYSILTNKLHSSIITIPSPYSTYDTIDLHIEQTTKPSIKCEIINGSPYFTINAKLRAQILTITGDSRYLNTDEEKLLEKYASTYITNELKKYLYKTSKQLNSDIHDFGSYEIYKYAFFNNWNKTNWLHNYNNSFFNVHTNCDISSSYLLLNS